MAGCPRCFHATHPPDDEIASIPSVHLSAASVVYPLVIATVTRGGGELLCTLVSAFPSEDSIMSLLLNRIDLSNYINIGLVVPFDPFLFSYMSVLYPPLQYLSQIGGRGHGREISVRRAIRGILPHVSN